MLRILPAVREYESAPSAYASYPPLTGCTNSNKGLLQRFFQKKIKEKGRNSLLKIG